MIPLIAFVSFLILGSAIFSAIEAAVFSVSINKVRELEEKKKSGASHLLKIKGNIRRPITSLVIFTNIFNIAGSMIVGVMVTQSLGSSKVGIASAILTFLVIIFAEIIPKSIGDLYATPIALYTARPLLYTTKILKPFIVIIEFITSPIPRKRKGITEEEIKALSKLGYLDGVIEKDEKEMINRIFLLNDLTARDIMTPRTVISAFEESQVLGDLEEDIYHLPHSRIPVYRENLDNILGICSYKDLLIALSKGEKDKKIGEIIGQEATFVLETIKIDRLIPLFQEKRCHLAIVVDKFGGTAGVVSLEDVLEQIIGEVVDETDKEINLRKKAEKLNSKNPDL